ncbi:hypothetical protein WDW86_11645 [Bdellovibrionota bacterium FG-2]
MKPEEVTDLVRDPQVMEAFTQGLARGRASQVERPAWSEAMPVFDQKLKEKICQRKKLSADACAAVAVGGIFMPSFDLANSQQVLGSLEKVKRVLGMLEASGAGAAREMDFGEEQIVAAKPKGGKTKAGKDPKSDASIMDLIFKTHSDSGIAKSKCPEYIPMPEKFCQGAKYNPTEAKGQADPKKWDFNNIASNVEDISFALVKDDFTYDMKQFLGNLYMERYLQQVLLNGGKAGLDKDLEELAKAASCIGGAGAVKAMTAGLPGLEDLPLSNGAYEAAAKKHRNDLVLAAHCGQAVEDRLSKLKNALGMEFTAGQGNKQSTKPHALITEEMMKSLYGEMKHSTKVGTLVQAGRNVGVDALNGVLGFPGLRHFLREIPLVRNKAERAAARCSWVGGQIGGVDVVEKQTRPGEREHCRNVMSEFMALGEELNGLYSAYPELGEVATRRNNGRDVVSSVQSDLVKASEGLHSKVKGYNQDFNVKYQGEIYDENGGIKACMTQFRKNPKDPASELIEVDEKALHQAGDSLFATKTARDKSMLDQLRMLCAEPEEAVKAAVVTPALMSAYFNCDRRSFGELFTVMNWPMEEAPVAAGPKACNSRTNSAWVACHLNHSVENVKKYKEISGEILSAGMDAAFLFGGFAGGTLKNLTWQAFGRSVIHGTVFGAGMIYGTEKLLAPSPEETEREIKRSMGLYRAGISGDINTITEANKALEELRAKDPLVDAVAKGFGMSLPFGLLAGGHAPIKAGGWAQTEISLQRMYRALRGEGALKGPEGAKFEAAMLELPAGREAAPVVAKLGPSEMSQPHWAENPEVQQAVSSRVKANKEPDAPIDRIKGFEATAKRLKQKFGTRVTRGDAAARLIAEHEAQTGAKDVKAFYDPKENRIVLAKDAKASDYIRAYKDAKQWAANRHIASQVAKASGTTDANGQLFSKEARDLDQSLRDRHAAQLEGNQARVKELDAKVSQHLKKMDELAKDDPYLASAAEKAKVATAQAEGKLASIASELKGDRPLHEMSPEHIAEVKVKYAEVLEETAKSFPGEEAEALQIVDILANRDKKSMTEIKEYFAKILCQCNGACKR